MLDWFFANATWFIIASLILMALLFLFSFKRQIKKVEDQTKTSEKGLKSRVLILAVIATGAVLVVITLLIVVSNLVIRGGIDISVSTEGIRAWIASHGTPILAIVLSSYVAYRIMRTFIPRIVEQSVKVRYTGDEAELSRRAQTLNSIILSTLDITIIAVAALMVIDETGQDITPLLAGAGIVGVAIGFGAQSLVKDLVNGLFIIMEDQYREGDVVKIADISGLVEDLSLRRTVLRDMDGTVHAIPNGQVVTASNYTKEWSRVNFDIPIAYYEDIDTAMEVINRVGAELAEDPYFQPMIISAPRALRVNDLSEKGVMIKVFGDTKPLKQWEVSGEMRKRLKTAFDTEAIDIPWDYGGIFTRRPPESGIQSCPTCGFVNLSSGSYCANCGALLHQVPPPRPNNPPVSG